MVFNQNLSNVLRDPVPIVGPFALFAVNLEDVNRSTFVPELLERILKGKQGRCRSSKGVEGNRRIVSLIVTALESPLMVVNVVFLRIAGASIRTRVKDVNFAVLVAQFPNHRFFKVVVALGTNRVNQTVFLLLETVWVARPLRTVAVPPNTLNIRACKVWLKIVQIPHDGILEPHFRRFRVPILHHIASLLLHSPPSFIGNVVKEAVALFSRQRIAQRRGDRTRCNTKKLFRVVINVAIGDKGTVEQSTDRNQDRK